MQIAVAYDFSCPWCWIGWQQAQRLSREYGVTFEWLPFELWPEGLEHTPSKPATPDPDRPLVPTRLELAYYASDCPKPRSYFHDDKIHNALEAVEYAKTVGAGNAMVDRLFLGAWMEGLQINDVEVLRAVGKKIVDDPDELAASVVEKRFADRITPFDDDAHAKGVYNVPTFFIGGKRYAEQPYAVLSRAVKGALR